MGKNNRQRRAAKKRKQGGRTTGAGAPPWGSGGPAWPPFDGDPGDESRAERNRRARADEDEALARLERLESTVIGAAVADDGDGVLDIALDRFERAALPFGIDMAPGMLADHLHEAVHDAWHRGWLPADLACLLRKDEPQLDLLALGIHHDLQAHKRALAPDTWQRQMAELDDGRVRDLHTHGFADAETWLSGHPSPTADTRRMAMRTGAFLIATLATLPTIPTLETVPCEWHAGSSGTRRADTTGIDPSMLAKIRALLAKAESTTFEAEAIALTAKAQALIAKHSIDAAVLAGSGGHDADDRPGARRLPVDDPYAQEKAVLLSAITGANRCRSVWMKAGGFSTVFGFPADLDAVELLYTSLLVQASTAMQAAGSQRDRFGRSSTRSFRQSFLVGYANRIAQRLDEATRGTVAEAEAEVGAALLPVLAARDERVHAAADEAFPDMVHRSSRVSNRSGYVAGQVAADQAQLGPEVAVTG